MLAVIDNPLAANSAELAHNPFLVNLNKFQSSKYKMSTLKTVVGLVTSSKAVSSSTQFLKVLEKLHSLLPTQKDQLGPLNENIKFKDQLIKDFQMLTDFIAWLNKFELDDNNTKNAVKTLNKCLELMDYLIDYLTIAIKSQEAMNELKVSKELLTIEQLKNKLIAA